MAFSIEVLRPLGRVQWILADAGGDPGGDRQGGAAIGKAEEKPIVELSATTTMPSTTRSPSGRRSPGGRRPAQPTSQAAPASQWILRAAAGNIPAHSAWSHL
jgi:hypothetical protein